VSDFNIKLSPVKQELNKYFSNSQELKVAYEFYSSYTQSNKKLSKIKEFSKFLSYSIEKYGKIPVINSINLLNDKAKSGTIHKSTVNLKYLEGIIKNLQHNEVLSVNLRQKTCSVCGTVLVNNLCPVCNN
jgi:hypothetical protein